ncbi:hypothetical protein MLD38_026523 [Melastoma candidum]|uniref:Uncharacterized protein n=1 Tax=Melastoma candidum TaxID=119954 RepID=A0ACB9NYQ6_9MYRT|nr:hypothetical protein MLD38_026523 [Melastoma candidum]
MLFLRNASPLPLLTLLLFSSSSSLSLHCLAFGSFGFRIHHRFSDPLTGFLSIDRFPERSTAPYYSALVGRDRSLHGRRLVQSDPSSLIFTDGNETTQFSSLGFLYYANVSIGTPSLTYMVALDTGSDLFWLPCDCSHCVKGLETTSGERLEFNIYSPNASSTSSIIPCNSSICGQQSGQCPSTPTGCIYEVAYLSNGTSSAGILVEDVLHLTKDEEPSNAITTNITFGCGQIQTGSFLDGAAPNGLFGLGMSNMSVPSMLANQGLIPNSFSMCFSADGVGRINFGDEGSSDQGETPFNLGQSHPTYTVGIVQINVGGKAANVEFDAIFDSGTSFTYLNDPAYSFISKTFNDLAQQSRYDDASLPFEYCYALSPNQSSFETPTLNLTMKGSDPFSVNDPIAVISTKGSYIYCLALVKSGDVNIIGQNFMTGYRIVFNRDKMVLGWTPSTCYDALDANTTTVNPTNTSAVPPAEAVNPDAPSPGSANRPDKSDSSSSHGLSSSQLYIGRFYALIVAIVLPFFALA